MALVNKIDSNVTGVRYALESSIGVLPAAASQKWLPLEPNSYSEFGGKVTTVARNPINSSRQRKKGVVTGQDASAGFVQDITQANLQDALQAFFFADVREKLTTAPLNSAAIVITSVNGANQYTAAAGLGGFVAGDLVFASGFGTAANNGLKNVSASAAGTVTVTQALVAEATPPAAAKFGRVGWQFGAGELTVVTPGGSYPVLTRASGTKDFTTFGLVPGEWIFIGGDSAATKFATAADNGFARVRSVTSTTITLDKTASTMVADVGTAKTVQLFFGRALKNETGTLVKRRTFQIERTLGYSDDADITRQQAEYLPGSLANEFSIKVPTAEKVTADIKFVSLRRTTMDENTTGANTLLSKAAVLAGGSAPALVEADAFNTSSDVSRFKLALVSATDSCPAPLFSFVQDIQLDIKNNVTPAKAVAVTGAFEMNAGQFEVGGKLTAYFASVAAMSAVDNNLDITMDAHFVKANAGITIDVPLIALGDGAPNVQQDAPITLPLDTPAATGAKIDPNLNHTLMMIFWDYLPALADV